MIIIQCQCGQVLRASPTFAGAKVTCPNCRKGVAITPAADQTTLIDGPKATKTLPPSAASAPPPPKARPRGVVLGAAVVCLIAISTALGVKYVPDRWFVASSPLLAAAAIQGLEDEQPAVLPAAVEPKPPAERTPEPIKPAVLESEQGPTTPVWQHASQSVRVGQSEVRIERVKIGRVDVARTIPVYSGIRSRQVTTTGTSKEDCLAIYVSIRNDGEGRLVHEAWGPERVSMTADRFLSLPLATPEPGARILGQCRQTPISPGQQLQDLIVFQLPSQLPQTLHLELDASHLGGHQGVRFEIPRAMIDR
jgi:hypothetical protein